MALNRKLSLLELTALGVAWKQGPITAYALMRDFAGSGAGYYRSGAGSIYPMVRRLTEGGFLEAQAVSGRADRVYTITERGKDAFRTWLAPPFAADEFTCAVDPFRTRVYHLAILSAEEQREFFRAVNAGLKDLVLRLEAIIAEYESTGDRLDVLAATGAMLETKARLKWIGLVESALGAS